MKKILNKLLTLVPTMGLIIPAVTSCTSDDKHGYVYVADYCDSTGQKECADKIQELINNNPHKTLYFKDGIYKLSHPIKTPGDPDKTVSLKLSQYAILQASDDYDVVRRFSPVEKEWRDEYNYMVQLGGLDRENDTTTIGSNFSFEGGYIDGGKNNAPGLEVTGGREVRVQNVNIKHVVRGFRIAPGVNSNSSDADVLDLNIICDESEHSLGMDIDGYDNTITNVRIGHTRYGVDVFGGGNMLRNIHPLHCGGDDMFIEGEYEDHYGFCTDEQNYFDYCYADNFGTAFRINNSRAVFNDCFAWWYNGHTRKETLIKFVSNGSKQFRSIFTNVSCGFSSESGHSNQNIILAIEGVTPEAKDPELLGYIHNIAICHRDFLLEKQPSSPEDPYHTYLSGVDVDY